MLKINKRQWLCLLGILLIIALAYTYLLPWQSTMQIGRASTTLAITSEGIGNGLDPLGNRFDINAIKSENVLSAAITAAGMKNKITVAELKKELFILPLSQTDTLANILSLTSVTGKAQDISEQITYPTSFVIGIKDTGLPSITSDKKLLANVIVAYKAYLKSHYLTDTASEPVYNENEIAKLDYPEMMEAMTMEAETLGRYISNYMKYEPKYASKKTGLTFNDLYNQAEILKNTDVANLDSLVKYYRITKNPDTRIQYEETLLKRAAVVAETLKGTEMTTSQILAAYDNSSNYIFASADSSGINLEPTKNKFYSDLLNTLVEDQTASIKASYHQQDILDAIAKMQEGMISGDQYKATTVKIDSGVSNVIKQMDQLKKTTREMAEEYYTANIDSKIVASEPSYQFESYGNPICNYLILLAIILVGRMIVIYLYKSECRIYFDRLNQFIRKLTRKMRKAEGN